MRKHGITILLVLLCLIGLRPLIMADTPVTPNWQVIFSEVLLGTNESGSAEYIELYNPSDQPVDLTNWKIEYLTASATNWDKPTRTINLSGSIDPYHYLLVASTAYDPQISAIRYSSTLSQSGGQIRLISIDNDTQTLQDLLAWGTAKLGLGDAVLAPSAGSSLNRLKNSEEVFEPSLNNIDDFITSTILTPLEDNLLPQTEVPLGVEEPNPEPTPTDTTTPNPENTTQTQDENPVVYYPIEISEIMPNPAEPLSDATDEFIELYNPYNFKVDLKDYSLLAGLNGTYKHIFKQGDAIEPGQYLLITSKDSSITLSNTAGRVSLIAPDGSILSETAPYSSAPEGQSWVFYQGSWQWTVTTTAGATNQFTVAPAVVKSTSKKSTASKAKTTKTKASTAKSKAKVSGVSNTKDEQPTGYLEEVSGPVNPLVLAGVAILVVLYACYEYRKDFANKFHQFRTNRATRRTSRINTKAHAGH